MRLPPIPVNFQPPDSDAANHAPAQNVETPYADGYACVTRSFAAPRITPRLDRRVPAILLVPTVLRYQVSLMLSRPALSKMRERLLLAPPFTAAHRSNGQTQG